MISQSAKCVVLALVLAGYATPGARAWGNDGHKTVCRIAYQLLEQQEQDEIDRLTRLYRPPGGSRGYRDFAEACTFADRARTNARANTPGWGFFNRFNNWHFLNVPRDTQEVNESHCGADCVLEGIEHHTARLANESLADWKRAEALFFLGHWMGDLHQPLHISFADDRGGNSISPIFGGFYASRDLHAVWDSGIIAKARGNLGWLDYAARLRDGITPALRDEWRAGSPLDWARESYAITILDDVDYCEWESNDEGGLCRPEGHTRTLGASYQQEFQDDVETRLQKAGVRLAAKVREALGLS